MKCSVVIDREYGSGGREVARLLSDKLGIPWYDGPLLVEAARKIGFDELLVADYDEEGVGSAISDLARRTPRYNTEGHVIDRAYLAYEERRKLFVKLATEGPCVFLGRCADVALIDRELPIISVFVYASDLRDRVERSMTVDGIPAERVDAFLQKKDAQRRRYYRSFTGRLWGEKENYDLCLDTSALGYPAAAAAIAGVWELLG